MQTHSPQTEPSLTPSLAAKPALEAVPPHLLVAVLREPKVARLLADVIERHRGELSFEGIVAKLRTPRGWILWVVAEGSDVKAILATELYFDVGGMKRCRIPFCTGEDAKTWVHLLSEIEAWARENGCSKLDMIARKGWAKHLQDYRMTHVVLEKDLTP